MLSSTSVLATSQEEQINDFCMKVGALAITIAGARMDGLSEETIKYVMITNTNNPTIYKFARDLIKVSYALPAQNQVQDDFVTNTIDICIKTITEAKNKQKI
jgi:hypothetical protein